VKFFAYRDIMQEVCLRLMGKKLLVALAMEGKFASEGLQAIDGDDDMLTAMARELVENKRIGESADNVWRSLGQLHPAPPMSTEKEVANAQPEHLEANSHPRPSTADSAPQSPPLGSTMQPQRPGKTSETGQLSLF